MLLFTCSYKLLKTLVATDLMLYRFIATVMQSCSKLFRGDVAEVFLTVHGTLLERETTTKKQQLGRSQGACSLSIKLNAQKKLLRLFWGPKMPSVL